MTSFPGTNGRTYWLNRVDGFQYKGGMEVNNSENEDDVTSTEKSGGNFSNTFMDVRFSFIYFLKFYKTVLN